MCPRGNGCITQSKRIFKASLVKQSFEEFFGICVFFRHTRCAGRSVELGRPQLWVVDTSMVGFGMSIVAFFYPSGTDSTDSCLFEKVHCSLCIQSKPWLNDFVLCALSMEEIWGIFRRQGPVSISVMLDVVVLLWLPHQGGCHDTPKKR